MSQRKLLLADDSITIQKVVNLTFADEGIEVITFGDGDSAMEKLTEIAPDLVMADVNMPGLNGYELCEKIRATDSLKNTPVILLVGSFEPFDEEKAKSVGADDFLTKPFQSIRQLVNKVTELLGASRNGESAASDNFKNEDTLRNFDVFDAYQEEFSSPDTAASQNSVSYGDAGMDDEMIQTAQPGGYSMDETSKFESKEISEPEYEAANATQPLSSEDVKEFPFAQPAETPAESEPVENKSYETVQEISGEHYLDRQNEAQETETAESATATEFDLSGENLLEIPFIEEDQLETEAVEETAETNVETETQTQEPESESVMPETVESNSDSYQQPETETDSNEIPAAETATTEENISLAQLSPEMIEAIAQRVVEKLSDRAVKDVAWEVVPQMADLIIKKMTEEKLKE